MQKLVWQNANGDTVDLTSTPYGITEWEGFANTSLNIQSQQVPFQDGGVFLDALLEQRELSVTLAMQDNGDLQARYRMRRELIHLLNPKLGEGYLIYTNDFISKRIKCVAQVPLFETHNSNDSGTPKASLAWTACEPYWEDLEETEVIFGITKQPIISNNGDIPCQIKMYWYTNYVKEGKLTNLKTNRYIKYNGILQNSIAINTNIGERSVLSENLELRLTNIQNSLYSLVYSNILDIYVVVGINGTILITKDCSYYEPANSGTTRSLMSITYSEDLHLFVVGGEQGTIITSPDGVNWTIRSSGVQNKYLRSVIYSEDLHLFVICGDSGTIITSPDGINWTIRSSGVQNNLNEITYSSELGLFVAVGGNGIVITSSDGVNWTIRNSGTTRNLFSVTYSEDFNLFIIVGHTYSLPIILSSSDGINWTDVQISISRLNLESVFWVDKTNMFMGYGRYFTLISYDGLSWIKYANNYTLEKCIYSNELSSFVGVGEQGTIITSSDGVNWTKINKGEIVNLKGITFSEKLSMFVGVGKSGYSGNTNSILTSPDGINWTIRDSGVQNQLNKITYSSELGLFVVIGEQGTIITSSDGVNWTIRNSETIQSLMSITYSEDLHLFVAVGGNGIVITSSDGVNWTIRNSGTTRSLMSITYSEDLHLFVAVGEQGTIITSSDGVNWTIRNSETIQSLMSITYSEDLHLFVIGSYNGIIFISYTGEDWSKINIEFQNQLNKITYSSELGLFVAVGGNGIVITSSDGVNWKSINSNVNVNFNDVTYSNKLNVFMIVSAGGINFYSIFTESTNLIRNISLDSDIGMNLDLGDNKFRINKDAGNMIVKIKYRQKYIGV